MINTYLKPFFLQFLVGLLFMAVLASCHAGRYTVFATGGVVMPRLNSSGSVWVYPLLMNNYIITNPSETGTIGGVGISYTSMLTQLPLAIDVGVAGYVVNFRKTSGVKHPYINEGNFDPCLFTYQSKSQLAIVEGRLFYTSTHWQPFALVGLGRANNRLSGYQEKPLGSAVASQLFTPATNGSVAWEMGLGIRHAVFENRFQGRYTASLEYRYMSVGEGRLGAFAHQTTSGRFKQSNEQADAILLTITAGFP